MTVKTYGNLSLHYLVIWKSQKISELVGLCWHEMDMYM